MPFPSPQLQAYLLETLGADIHARPCPGAHRLPAYLSQRYLLLEATLFGHPLLFMIDESPTEDPPGTIATHIAAIRAIIDRPIVYIRPAITAYNRKRLIQHRIPFIIPGNQMYLPHLGIDLRERFRSAPPATSHVKPSTQAILIHILLHEPAQDISSSDIVQKLGYTPMTLSRAFDELETAGLAESRMKQRHRTLRLTAPKPEVWQRAQKFLRDPVRARHYLLPSAQIPAAPHAGLSALAHYTMVAEPPAPIIAIGHGHWQTIRESLAANLLPLREPDAIEIEIWRYPPRPWRAPDVVDPLSLSLSLQSVADERVSAATDQMLESIPW